jgi:hypothetical protein
LGHSVEILCLIQTINYQFLTLDSLLILYLTPVRHTHQNVANVWNYITSTEAKKQERLQWQFVAQCHYHFPHYDNITYDDFVKFLKLHTLRNRRYFFNALYFIVYLSLTLSLSDLHIIVIPIIPCKLRDFSLFTATCRNSLSGRGFSAANGLCKEVNALKYL